MDALIESINDLIDGNVGVISLATLEGGCQSGGCDDESEEGCEKHLW